MQSSSQYEAGPVSYTDVVVLAEIYQNQLWYVVTFLTTNINFRITLVTDGILNIMTIIPSDGNQFTGNFK